MTTTTSTPKSESAWDVACARLFNACLFVWLPVGGYVGYHYLGQVDTPMSPIPIYITFPCVMVFTIFVIMGLPFALYSIIVATVELARTPPDPQ